ncbi:MAG: laccase domain protein [Candidatus Binatia bacterium]|nr:MAG: laccase domain protein [Candidatus Binatia bacterium]
MGEFATLNLSASVGDHPSAVAENWARVQRAFPEVQLWLRMRQVHGTAVRVVDHVPSGEPPECDGLVTNMHGAAVCVLTADCVPILLASSDGALVAAVHAGWRGTAGRVAAEAVRAMVENFDVPATQLWAALGPSIGACCYEVGDEVAALVAAAGLGKALIRGRRGRCHLNLRLANRVTLHEAGVPPEQIFDVGGCTACSTQMFFSHRGQKGRAGRQLSFIVCARNPLQLHAVNG